MAQLELKASSRKVFGKKVRFLRRDSITPLHLFGSGIESLALQSDTAEVEKTLSLAGETQLIALTVGKERNTRPVLVRGVQRNPLKGSLLHVDLYQVRMDERVSVDVPIVLVGQAAALEEKGNSLLQELDSLSIESLPDRIPANIRVDVTDLAEPGQAKRVKDVRVDPGVIVISDPDQIVAIIVSRPEEKAVEEAPAAEEGEAPAEAGTSEESKEET